MILKMNKILIPALSFIVMMISSCSSRNDEKDELIQGIREDIVSNIQEAMNELNDSSIRELQIQLNNSSEKVDVTTTHMIGEDGKIHVDVNVNMDDDSGTDRVAIIAVVLGTVGFFMCPILMVGIICYFIYRSKRDRNHVINTALTTGHPLPKEFFYQSSPTIKLQSGFIYMAWATGLFLFFYMVGFESIPYLALIPFIIGVGKVVGWFISQKKENDKDKDIIIEEFRDDVK